MSSSLEVGIAQILTGVCLWFAIFYLMDLGKMKFLRHLSGWFLGFWISQFTLTDRWHPPLRAIDYLEGLAIAFLSGAVAATFFFLLIRRFKRRQAS